MLTREYIMNLEAGREMDWGVAKMLVSTDKKLFNFAYEAGNYNYSTDISAAMELILSITNKSEKERCGPCVRLEHDGIWHVRIGTTRAMKHELPFAIARCALLTTIQGEET